MMGLSPIYCQKCGEGRETWGKHICKSPTNLKQMGYEELVELFKERAIDLDLPEEEYREAKAELLRRYAEKDKRKEELEKVLREIVKIHDDMSLNEVETIDHMLDAARNALSPNR